jgi:hypothetical protein
MCNRDPDTPHLKRTTLFKLLLDKGLEFKKKKRLSVIINIDDIILWR